MVPNAKADLIVDAVIEEIIDLADAKVREDLSNLVDVALIPDTDPPTCDEYINEMSRFKTNEWVLVKLFGAKRKLEEVTDIDYWAGQYATKLEQIKSGEVDLGDVALPKGSLSASCKEDVTPAIGHGKYGGFLDEDGLEAVREDGVEDNQDE